MITLLNGEEWQEAEILKRMEDDSFYYGHLGQHALSSSSLKKLLQSPKAYQKSLRMSESSQALRDGRLVHMCILEPHKVKDLTILEGTKARKEFKEHTERELKDVTVEMSGERGQRISHEQLAIIHDSLDRRLDMYNYLFKLVELDDND